jgi:hypothetical protein
VVELDDVEVEELVVEEVETEELLELLLAVDTVELFDRLCELFCWSTRMKMPVAATSITIRKVAAMILLLRSNLRPSIDRWIGS